MFNNSSNLYGSEWLAVVFNNRNKSYGAYELRAQSDNNTTKALFIAAPLFILLFVGPIIYGMFHKEAIVPIVTDREYKIAPQEIHEIKKEEPKKAEPVAAAKPIVQEKLKSVNFSKPVVVEDTKLDPPTNIEVQTSVISSTTQDGKEGKENVLPVEAGTPIAGIPGGTGTKADDEVKNLATVDVYPEFPGGMAAWSKFIQKNLRYPGQAQEEGIQGKVYISFVVEKDGSITDVKLVKGIGFGCDDEAMRVIKKSPKWSAGKQNNQAVRVRYSMPINYVMSN